MKVYLDKEINELMKADIIYTPRLDVFIQEQTDIAEREFLSDTIEEKAKALGKLTVLLELYKFRNNESKDAYVE